MDIGEDLADKIRHKNLKHFDLDETSQEEVLAKLEKLSPFKSSGIQNISTSFIKEAMVALISEFTHF